MKSSLKCVASLILLIAGMEIACSQNTPDIIDTDSRAEVPAEPDVTAAIKSINTAFAPDYARAEKAIGSKSVLARRLLKAASETKDDPVSRYAGAFEANRLAIEAADVTTMRESIDLLSSEYRISESSFTADSFEAFSIAASSFTSVKLLADACIESLENAVAVNDLKSAGRILKVSEQAAKRISDRPLASRLDSARKYLDMLNGQLSDYEKAIATVEVNPKDVDSKRTIGIYLGLRLDSWEEGEKHIAQVGDEHLHGLFQKKCASPVDLSERLALADGWWEWSLLQKDPVKTQAQVLAIAEYNAILSDLSGLGKKRAEERIKSLRIAFPVRCNSRPADQHEIALELPEDVVLFIACDEGDSEGKIGKAVNLESSQRLDVNAANLPAGNSARSVMFWFLTEQNHSDAVPFRYGTLAPMDAVYIALLDTARGVPGRPGYIAKGQAVVGSVGGAGEFGAGPILTDGKWHHVALTHDGKNETILFVDGKQVGQVRRTFRTSPSDFVLIGRYDDGPTMDGKLDEFVILNRPVKRTEIVKIMNDGVMKTLGKPAK